MNGRIAVVGGDRQIYVVDPESGQRRQVTYSKVPGPLMAWGGAGGRDQSAWPCWSPDGSWLACFQHQIGEESAGPAVVSVVEVDGVEERQLAVLNAKLPIYAQWSPGGSHLAVLTQDEDELELSVCGLDDVGASRVVESGVPLFFSWTPVDERLFIHVGSKAGQSGRLVVRDCTGSREDQIYRDLPGSFCTPMCFGERALYVAAGGGGSCLCVSDLDGEHRRSVTALDGLLAMVPSPDGAMVALASAPGGEGSPYEGVWLVPLNGETDREKIIADTCVAYFWCPTGDRIVYATWEEREQRMTWRLMDLETRKRRTLCGFWPTRDQLFYLHFFEQFCQSHPNISPDGTTLVFSSRSGPPTGTGNEDDARVYTIDLNDRTAVPMPVSDGTFATFSR